MLPDARVLRRGIITAQRIKTGRCPQDIDGTHGVVLWQDVVLDRCGRGTVVTPHYPAARYRYRVARLTPKHLIAVKKILTRRRRRPSVIFWSQYIPLDRSDRI